MKRSSDQWKALFKQRDALWIHGGNPKQPHAKLASGKHSSGFFMAKLVTEDDQLRKEMVGDLLDILVGQGLDLFEIDRVVGPSTGATKLAESLAAEIYNRRWVECKWASPEKADTDGHRKMVFTDSQNCVQAGERVLLIEDVLTTGSSVGVCEEAVTANGGICLPFILTIINRSGQSDVGDKKIIALIHHHLPVWDDERTCDLCIAGSMAIKPKQPPENWSLLNAVH